MLWRYTCTLILVILWIQYGIIRGQKGCPLQEAILPCRCLMKGAEYQIWCTHSDLPTILDGLKAVAQFITSPIDELIIENNVLPSLPGRTFHPLKVLRLMLRHNGLERVSSDWLAGLQSTLLEIFIVEPQLRSLPDDSLTQLSALQAITIQTRLLKRLPLFSGLPKLRYLQIESESLIELSSANFKNNPLLEKLHVIYSPRLTKLEANLLKDLPSLNVVNISYCGISWMHPRAITKLPQLKELWLAGNKITDAGMIAKGTRDLLQLEVIGLDYNRINKLGEASFVDLPSIKKIHLSNNEIAELHHGAFQNVPQLKSLDLNKNTLKRVHPESFIQQSGSGLEELSLVDNTISRVTELRSLLDALPRLMFLDASYNNFETIQFGALRGHPTLEYLNLDHNKLFQIDKEAFMAMPALRELRMKNNSLTNILEPPLWNLPALKGLDLSENYFKTLDRDFLANLPSLRRIDLSRNQLTNMDPNLFLPTPSLEHINVSHNDFRAIHPTTFRHLINLYELDISHNNLLEFVQGIPKGVEYLRMQYNKISKLPLAPSAALDLPSLRMLDLTSNRIETLPERPFVSLSQLRRLFLGKNLIHKLDENSLVGLKRLEVLDLQENRISQIHPSAFKEMTNLKELSLKNNHLDFLLADVFKYTPVLKRLDISKNQLAEILPGTLDKNLDIQIVDVSNNKLVKVPSTLYGLKKLKLLNLANNRIKIIDTEILGSLIDLREIKLSYNFIQEVKQGAFTNLQYLKTIFLDNNELEFIEPNAIRALLALKVVKMNKNKLKEIPNLALNNLPSLQVVELQENMLQNIAPNAFNLVPNLLILNLSSNHLSDLEKSGLQSHKSLEILDMSYNRISRMVSPSLEKMEWLVELKMDNNDICGVNGFTFNGMPRLRILSLKNNKMMSFPERVVGKLGGNIALLDLDGNPLICGCNMMWFQVWLQEMDQQGPRCVDGGLLRDTPLARQDCLQDEQNVEPIAPGCEAEILTGPAGVYKTSQVSAPWMNLKSAKNTTREVLGAKNNLAPSPEESDYFYDDYVDYPYNDSLVDSVLPNEKQQNKLGVVEPVTMKVLLSTRSPHFTPGDTPTLYAGLRNKTRKPDIPPKVSNSPSSSGFTFFGIPLPNLNLNELIGTGARVETKRPPATLTADRKTAIVNDPIKNTGRSNMGNMSLGPPPYHHMRPPYIMNWRPPNVPEMQSGFVPILPGSGGFKPIPNPTLQMTAYQNNTRTSVIPTESPRDVSVSPSSITNVIKPTVISQISKSNQSIPTSHKVKDGSHAIETSTVPPTTPFSNTKFSTYSKMSNQNISNHMMNASTTIIEKEKRQNVETSRQSDNGKETGKHDVVETVSVFIQEFSTDMNEPTTSFPGNETESSTNNVNVVTDYEKNNKSQELTSTSPISKLAVGTAEVVPTNSSDNIKTTKREEVANASLIEEAEKSPPLPLVIPESQQSPLRHGGRSTITKVFSPHISEQSPLQSSIIELPRVSQLHQREAHSDQYVTTEATSNGDNDWYFANYNKTRLEPYVARISGTSGGQHSSEFLQICLIFYYVKTVLIFLL